MLEHKQKQKLVQKLSPQQIQLMKLIQLPSLDLEKRIREEIEENPALEQNEPKNENEDIDVDKILEYSNDNTLGYNAGKRKTSVEDVLLYADYNDEKSGFEVLIDQLNFIELNETERKVAEYIIGNLDEAGYFLEDINASIDNLLFNFNIDIDKVLFEKVLKKIQLLEPKGIAATSLKNCMLTQLKSKNKTPIIKLAIDIISKEFELYVKKHYTQIIKKLDIKEEDFLEANSKIIKLNPKPGKALNYRNVKNQYVTVDFIVTKKDDELLIDMPKATNINLSINNEYKNILETYKETKNKTKTQRNAASFIKQKLDSAVWFIDAIKQRQNTLYKTMKGIMEYQKEYFMADGDIKKLKPMILKDISKHIQMDESTISRVVNNKYVKTDFGIYILKYFFSESLKNTDGEDISTKTIKKILQELIIEENKTKPLSDKTLSDLLLKKGYKVARRTVAKYREQLKIPISRLRKEIK